jgi:UDP-2,3-diacylglucosamine hydrolase
VPPFAQLQAPPEWRTVDFISDLHLQVSEPETFEAWRRYMAETPADAVFILGDLFEVWVGDDAATAPGFAADCAVILQATAARVALFFMRGNRDFLIGDGFLRACQVTPLTDPTALDFGAQRWLLTHGDALCLADAEYMRFRSQVRTPEWQHEFLSRPLAERQAIAADLRERSTARKNSGVEYADVDSDAARAWLKAADAQVLIHGHTHRPGDHDLGPRGQRVVLSDWDARSHPPRQQVLRLTSRGLRRVALT